MSLDLPAVLRTAGLSVFVHAGWQDRGRPGTFTPRAVMIHHDASAVGPSPTLDDYIIKGRPESGTPGPLSQLWVCLGCKGEHAVGTWHVLAAGRANHAGTGAGWGVVPKDSGNTYAYGVETDHTTGEAVDPTFRASIVKGSAALLKALGASPVNALPGHKDYAPGRKSDPDWDMNLMRRDVAAAMTQPAVKPAPIKETPDMPSTGTVYVITLDTDRVWEIRTWDSTRRHIKSTLRKLISDADWQAIKRVPRESDLKDYAVIK